MKFFERDSNISVEYYCKINTLSSLHAWKFNSWNLEK